jgi:hypothetical protein
MTQRPRHQKKEIEDAIQAAIDSGWRYQESGSSSHCWGTLLCPEASIDGHKFIVSSTPKNSGNHAKKIRKAVEKCIHIGDESGT